MMRTQVVSDALFVMLLAAMPFMMADAADRKAMPKHDMV